MPEFTGSDMRRSVLERADLSGSGPHAVDLRERDLTALEQA
jgi:uncharacterized protein YjbI with pentapeptide repeats